VESVRPEKHTRDMGIYGDDVYYDAKEADLYFDRLEAKLTEAMARLDRANVRENKYALKASKFKAENVRLREAVKWIVYGGIASGEVIMPNHLQDKLNQALKDGAS